MQRALKKQSLRHKKEMVALVDITEHPSETSNVEIYIVNSTTNKHSFRNSRILIINKEESEDKSYTVPYYCICFSVIESL